jgi:2-methylcitrate dehydratase PrpD
LDETKRLAGWLAGLRFSDLPENVVDFTKRFILDDVGCILGGSLQLANKSLMRDVLAQGEKPESTIAVYGNKTSAPSAALINGAFLCGWDYDSGADGGSHLGSQTAALLAMAERELPNGKEIITAEAAGIEGQSRVGIATGGVGESNTYPWHSNTTIGPFGAVVASGKILGLDAEAMENAIAIVTHNMGGNYQHYYGWGSNMKRIRCGIGAWSGIQAALLAKEGLTGPKEALEGNKGYLKAMHGREDGEPSFYDKNLITADLGKKWYTLTYHTKGFGIVGCSELQTPTLTAIALKKKYEVKPEDIESVVIEHCLENGLFETCHIPGTELGNTPEQRLGTQGWSIQWMVAMGLILGKAGIREQLNNIRPYGRYYEIEELSKRVENRLNKEYYIEHFKGRPYPSNPGGRIIVKLKNGGLLEHEPLPYLGCKMSDGTINIATFQQLVEKMREQAPLVGISRDKQDKIVDIVAHMEDQNDIISLMSNMVK